MPVVAAPGRASVAAPAKETPRPTALEGTSPRVVGARADCSAVVTCTVAWEIARMPVRVFAGPTPDAIDRSAPVAKATAGTEVVLPNPDPGAPRYFEVVARGARHGPVVGDRFLHLEGAPNTRDLGGYQTIDGLRTRWGRLFRSDGLGAVTDADRARLTQLGLPSECPDTVDAAAAVDDTTLITAARSVTHREARERDRALLRRLARDPRPQWVHCTRLADRLGWSTALVLATLGVQRETIVADQLVTNATAPVLPADRRYVDVAFEAIRKRYETFGRYLGKGLGLDEPTWLRLRKRYVTDR